MGGWAASVEERLSQQLQHTEPSARARKKKC